MSAVSKLSKKEVIKLNESRRKKLNAHYNPITGEGSLLERFKYMAMPGITLHLPLRMQTEDIIIVTQKKGWYKTADLLFSKLEQQEDRVQELERFFHLVRCKHDFEYWAATSATIENKVIEDQKENFAKSKFIKFVLNPPQRISLRDLESMRLAGLPVRLIELKHRQYGSTTMKNAYAFWVQNVVNKGMTSYICSLDNSSATKIVGRYETIIDYYPNESGQLKLKPYRGLRNSFEVVGSGSRLNIGTAERPNAPSGDSTQLALISEAGKMKSTQAKGANKLITNLVSMVPMQPNTYIMVESTAEESGDWFRRNVFKAKRGETAFKLTFISWITDPSCQVTVDALVLGDFIDSMSEYEWRLWNLGATLDQINWWRVKRQEYDHEWEMMQEHPATVEEAFAGAGKKRFTPTVIDNARAAVVDALYVGELIAKADVGPESLQDVKFVANNKGDLRIWMHPDDVIPPHPVAHRYAMYVDIGGQHKNSDYSVVKVIDRYPMLEGGSAECAAEWRGHIDPTRLAWLSAQIGVFFMRNYDYPLLAVEYNALNARGNNTEGVHYLTVFNEIGNYYPNLYTRKDVSKVANKSVTHYGFYLTYSSKTMLINGLHKAWEHGGYIEHSDVTVDEASYFIIKQDNTLGAIEGEHDDSLIATGGALHISNDYMPAPYYVKPMEPKQNKTYNEAML
jgi:hypothetical protein